MSHPRFNTKPSKTPTDGEVLAIAILVPAAVSAILIINPA